MLAGAAWRRRSRRAHRARLTKNQIINLPAIKVGKVGGEKLTVKTAGNEFSAPLLEKGERVLVFSQFVGLLEILREEIDSRGWRHWYLAG